MIIIQDRVDSDFQVFTQVGFVIVSAGILCFPDGLTSFTVIMFIFSMNKQIGLLANDFIHRFI